MNCRPAHSVTTSVPPAKRISTGLAFSFVTTEWPYLLVPANSRSETTPSSPACAPLDTTMPGHLAPVLIQFPPTMASPPASVIFPLPAPTFNVAFFPFANRACFSSVNTALSPSFGASSMIAPASGFNCAWPVTV